MDRSKIMQHISTNRLTLRPITAADTLALVDLIQAAFEEYRGQIDPPSSAHGETVESVQRLIDNEQGVLALCHCDLGDGELAGCVFYDVRADEVYLHRLAVAPRFRRHGVGKALIEQVEILAWALDMPRVRLNVRVALPKNRAYYEKLGYTVTGFDFHKGYVQFTTAEMSKPRHASQMRKIEVVPYDPDWLTRFESEAALLRRVFANQLLALHHVGSTSIPGIHAKPIIDIMLLVKDIDSVYAFDPTMLALGYQPLGENGIVGRRFYRKGGETARSHHLHVYETDNSEVDQHLALRDYLIAHPVEAQCYSDLKQHLAQQHPSDIQAYMDGKDGLIKELLAKALIWWRIKQ